MANISAPIVMPSVPTFGRSTPTGCSRELLLRMADAGVKAVECMRALHERGSNLVTEALRGSTEFVEWQHYPTNEAYDPKSHAQYYFHAHPPDERDAPDFGHFHTFMRQEGMPIGVRPVGITESTSPADNRESLCHLIAISMTPAGMPARLFTTNRWVTDETWYTAADVIAMLDRFTIDLEHPSLQLSQWLTAMMVLFRPQIELLLTERDRTIELWQSEHGMSDALEDRRLEITSSLDVSLYDHIERIDQELESLDSQR